MLLDFLAEKGERISGPLSCVFGRPRAGFGFLRINLQRDCGVADAKTRGVERNCRRVLFAMNASFDVVEEKACVAA